MRRFAAAAPPEFAGSSASDVQARGSYRSIIYDDGEGGTTSRKSMTSAGGGAVTWTGMPKS
jgi:hypothetical protein